MISTELFGRFTLLFPHLLTIVYGYKNALLKAHDKKIHCQFLQQCYEEHVCPVSLLPRRLANMKDKPFGELQRVVLRHHIARTREEREQAFQRSFKLRRTLEQRIPAAWKKPVYEFCKQRLANLKTCVRTRLGVKLDRLIENSDWTRHRNEKCFINFSNTVLDENTKSALGYGMKFSCNNLGINPVSIAKGFVNLQQNGDIDDEKLNICKGLAYGALSQPNYSTCPNRFIKALNHLKKDKHVHITKADKSNCLVLLNKSDYVEKMNDLLRDGNTYELQIKNPVDSIIASFNRNVKEILSDCGQMAKKFISIGPVLPYMYGVVKTHKRPIVSSVGSPTYKLSKWLVKELSPLVGTVSNSHIRNNVDLIYRLKNVNCTYNFELVSFDVTSLFTRVPIEQLLNYFHSEFKDYDFTIPLDKIIALMKLCIVDCQFTFDGQFFKQIFGMSMGNPLSPVCSNLYMEFFEKYLLPSVLPDNVHWFRYVDDILCMWPCDRNVDNFLQQLNQLAPSIHFTKEQEYNNMISFLDVNIHRSDRSLKFSIFRKPSNINSYVHYYSAHPSEVKQSVFSSMYLRALRICSEEFLDTEFHNINQIAANHQYPTSVIEKAKRNAQKTFYGNFIKTKDVHDNILVLPYSESFAPLVSKFKQYFNISLIFSSIFSLNKYLIKNSPATDGGCVYKIPCTSCDKIYIGQTGKPLEKRLKQHKYSIRTGQVSNALFLHTRDQSHAIDFPHAQSILNVREVKERTIVEAAAITFDRDRTLNLSEGVYNFDSYLTAAIVKFNKIVERL